MFLFLAVRLRSVVRALLSLVPVAIAVGMASIVAWAFDLKLSPMTAVGGPLVIAACTEFTSLILLRFVEERGRGYDPRQAMDVTAARTGRAFIVSALTAIAGVAVLSFSSLPLLRDFGRIVAMNVTVALLSALVVLPPMLVWADRRNLVSRGLLRKKVEPYADAPPVHYPAPDPRPRRVPEPPRTAGGRGVPLGAQVRLAARREAVADSEAEREPEVLELAHVELEGRGLAAEHGREVGRPPFGVLGDQGEHRAGPGPGAARPVEPLEPAIDRGDVVGASARRCSRARHGGPARPRGGTRSGTRGGRRRPCSRASSAARVGARRRGARRRLGCAPATTMSTVSTSMMPRGRAVAPPHDGLRRASTAGT